MTVNTAQLSGSRAFTIALAGQPNTGKSTVFNQLTGARQHVGNWPGKIVEQKSGTYTHLEQRIGVPVIPMVVAKKQGLPELIQTIHRLVRDQHTYAPRIPAVGDAEKQTLAQVKALIGAQVPAAYPPDWVALKLQEGDAAIKSLVQQIGHSVCLTSLHALEDKSDATKSV